jgi:hypothetical protein
MEAANQVVSRTKTVDSSFLTMKNQMSCKSLTFIQLA